MIGALELNDRLTQFAQEAKLYFHAFGVGDLLLDKQIDHVAVKGVDRKEYDAYIEHFKPLSKRIAYAQVNNRSLATAELYEPLNGGSFGPVALVEIMEPRPDAIVTTQDMIDHIELFVESLEAVELRLKQAGLKYQRQNNDAHTTVVVEINEFLQEVKFTDMKLMHITERQIAEGTSIVVS